MDSSNDQVTILAHRPVENPERTFRLIALAKDKARRLHSAIKDEQARLCVLSYTVQASNFLTRS